ncbi:MAG: hypothetical protein JWR27_1202 [Aeromicrobium sp.]|jgi:hypothetical protein|nr:hypothetical protein [Aeromicrobium sp.]
MRFRQSRSLGSKANVVVGDLTSRVDDRTGEVALRTARTLAVAVRLLRIPSAVVLAAPVPFILTTLLLAAAADGGMRGALLVVGIAMAVVSGVIFGRRRRILQAVEDPDLLADELRVLINLTGKVEETRGALAQIAGGGGWRVLGRLQGVWKGTRMTGSWIDQIGDLRRARYFAPPKIGTTISLTMAALWLVPTSIVIALLALVGTAAGSL